jgi:hypothetical protein
MMEFIYLDSRSKNMKNLKIAVFWVVAPCSLVEVYQRFRGPCCLHHQGDEELVCGESVIVMLHEYHVITDVALMLLVTKIITSSFYCVAVSIRLSVVSITSKTLCRSEVTTFNCNYKKSDLKAFTFIYLFICCRISVP